MLSYLMLLIKESMMQLKEVKKKAILLCFMDKDHYDVVYKKDHIAVAGFCQSMVYKLLYEDVFKIPNVDDIVHNMLYEKNSITTQAEMQLLKPKIRNEDEAGPSSKPDSLWDDTENPLNVAPFPFKVAKALDPNIYRNIEYDTWGEVRRELRLSDWYYGDDKLILGTRCIYNDPFGTKHDCYIQELLKDQNKCIIYLTKEVEKKTVNYSDLSPEDDAKPWPLPYRFMKNLVLSPEKPPVDVRHPQRSHKKKNKDKKRTKSESSLVSVLPATSEPIENYVGMPLQMQPSTPIEQNNNQTVGTSTETQTDYTVAESTETTPDPSAAQNRYPYGWQPYGTPLTPTPFVWPQAPQPFNYKTVVASAPVTPDVIPYHDVNNPFYYNYHVSNVYPQQNYPWLYAPSEYQQQSDDATRQPIVDQSEQQYVEVAQSPLVVEQQPQTNGYEAMPQPAQTETTLMHERPRLTLNLTPPSPNTAVKMFPSVITVPPGTPVLYAVQPQEMSEVLMSPTQMMYASPAVDAMSYMPRNTFVFPPTPPSTWYTPGVTSQGFVFPPQY
ncbi:unnamed protein product [Acanthoscelides obtectus]|uniref:Uncharacterized protein n=2 Tax=Acanthoscelides obtectus TaxID=200917 RepID=A0A9P0P4Z2_ACAOB|nr:unnamed protein product [Acanthoscelides obtectus]CAK1676450.1 Putative bifunctional UDP-N-acetylglucosamine transferase and deubiquitinase ALG13 [Acanthoscelides obtectus]